MGFFWAFANQVTCYYSLLFCIGLGQALIKVSEEDGTPCLEVGNVQNKKQSNAIYSWAVPTSFKSEQPVSKISHKLRPQTAGSA